MTDAVYLDLGESIFGAMAADAAAFVKADRSIRAATHRGGAGRPDRRTGGGIRTPTSPPKSTDSRTAKWEGETCQLEALDPSTLATVVEEAITLSLDTEVYEEVLDEERGQRAEPLGLPPGEPA